MLNLSWMHEQEQLEPEDMLELLETPQEFELGFLWLPLFLEIDPPEVAWFLNLALLTVFQHPEPKGMHSVLELKRLGPPQQEIYQVNPQKWCPA